MHGPQKDDTFSHGVEHQEVQRVGYAAVKMFLTETHRIIVALRERGRVQRRQQVQFVLIWDESEADSYYQVRDCDAPDRDSCHFDQTHLSELLDQLDRLAFFSEVC